MDALKQDYSLSRVHSYLYVYLNGVWMYFDISGM